MRKQHKVFILILFFLMKGGSSAAQIQQEQLLTKFPKAAESLSLLRNFPLLEQLLQVNSPWQGNPLLLKDIVLPEELTLAQGSEYYPLLYRAQRSASWPGMPVLGQLAYEVEYYVFDPTRPVIKIHIGRPLRYDMQHSRVEALAAAESQRSSFPYLNENLKEPLYEAITRIVTALAPYGAKELAFKHPKIKKFRLPEGTILTCSDYSGSTNGTTYIQLTIEPEDPIKIMKLNSGLNHKPVY